MFRLYTYAYFIMDNNFMPQSVHDMFAHMCVFKCVVCVWVQKHAYVAIPLVCVSHCILSACFRCV